MRLTIMNYDENIFKEKANRKARKIWLIFALLLSANYGSDVANGLQKADYYIHLFVRAGCRSSLARYYYVSKGLQRILISMIW